MSQSNLAPSFLRGKFSTLECTKLVIQLKQKIHLKRKRKNKKMYIYKSNEKNRNLQNWQVDERLWKGSGFRATLKKVQYQRMLTQCFPYRIPKGEFLLRLAKVQLSSSKYFFLCLQDGVNSCSWPEWARGQEWGSSLHFLTLLSPFLTFIRGQSWYELETDLLSCCLVLRSNKGNRDSVEDRWSFIICLNRTRMSLKPNT